MPVNRDRQTETDRDRQTETQRERGERDTERERQTDRQRQTERQRESETDRQKETDRQTDRQRQRENGAERAEGQGEGGGAGREMEAFTPHHRSETKMSFIKQTSIFEQISSPIDLCFLFHSAVLWVPTLKGLPGEDASWSEYVENVQILLFAGFLGQNFIASNCRCSRLCWCACSVLANSRTGLADDIHTYIRIIFVRGMISSYSQWQRSK